MYVEGSLRTRKWTDQASGQERYATEIRADSMQMLGSKPSGNDEGYGQQEQRPVQRQAPAPRQQQAAPAPRQGGGGFEDMDDSIPFRDPMSKRGFHLVV